MKMGSLNWIADEILNMLLNRWKTIENIEANIEILKILLDFNEASLRTENLGKSTYMY